MVSSLPIFLVSAACLVAFSQAQLFGEEQINEPELLEVYNSRQLYLNSSSVGAAIAIVGVVIIILAVALYLFDSAAARNDNAQSTYYGNPPYSQQNNYGYSRYSKR